MQRYKRVKHNDMNVVDRNLLYSKGIVEKEGENADGEKL
jgi:hypothetical protein